MDIPISFDLGPSAGTAQPARHDKPSSSSSSPSSVQPPQSKLYQQTPRTLPHGAASTGHPNNGATAPATGPKSSNGSANGPPAHTAPGAKSANGSVANHVAAAAPHSSNGSGGAGAPPAAMGRKRSNSRSQVLASSSLPSASAAAAAAAAAVSNGTSGASAGASSSSASASSITPAREYPEKRVQMQYIVTLIPLNETFIKKNLLVPYFPETLKLGRPAGSKVKPEINNGYFDSRVLSRNHAAMFIDPESGKLMIKDLGSSNGTFVNESKIGSDPVELKIGDIIYLGFNIEVDTSHKKISAKIENINIMPNYMKRTPSASGVSVWSPAGGHPGGPAAKRKIPGSSAGGSSGGAAAASAASSFMNELSGADLKHYNFIQSIFDAAPDAAQTPTAGTAAKHPQKPAQGPIMSFDNALFGDINPSLEDSMLGLNPKGGCGIFNNSQITNSISLEQTITVLTNNLSKVRQQNSTLKSLEDFVKKYQQRLNELNSAYLQSQYQEKLQKYEARVEDANQGKDKLKQEFDKYKSKKEQKVYQLEQQVLKLKGESDTLNMQLRASKHALKKQEEQFKQSVAQRDAGTPKPQETATDVGDSSSKSAPATNGTNKSDAAGAIPTTEDASKPAVSAVVDAETAAAVTAATTAASAAAAATAGADPNSKKLPVVPASASGSTARKAPPASDTVTEAPALSSTVAPEPAHAHGAGLGSSNSFRDLLPPVSTPPTLEVSAVNATGRSFAATPPSAPLGLLPSPDLRDSAPHTYTHETNETSRDRRNDSINVTPPVSDDEDDVSRNFGQIDAVVELAQAHDSEPAAAADSLAKPLPEIPASTNKPTRSAGGSTSSSSPLRSSLLPASPSQITSGNGPTTPVDEGTSAAKGLTNDPQTASSASTPAANSASSTKTALKYNQEIIPFKAIAFVGFSVVIIYMLVNFEQRF